MPKPASSPKSSPRSHWLIASLMAGVAALVAACKSAPDTPAPTGDRQPPSAGSTVPPDTPSPVVAGPSKPSSASTARAYRQDAAQHVYAHNAQRIYKGKLPPQLYAVGVLDVELDRNGQVSRFHWLRAPRHAPEVIKEIERTVRAAAPFPVASRLGKVTYTDTWLWDKSGHFQLDTLTEGQR